MCRVSSNLDSTFDTCLQKRPHVIWKENYRQAYLDEMTRFAGRADFQGAKQCPDCVARKAEVLGSAEYRCEECLLPDLCCGPCCIRRHRMQPFHRIKVLFSFHHVLVCTDSRAISEMVRPFVFGGFSEILRSQDTTQPCKYVL